MKVPNPPGSGKNIAKGKGVPSDGESEGSRRQTSDLTNRNHIEVACEGITSLLWRKQGKSRVPNGTHGSVGGRLTVTRSASYPIEIRRLETHVVEKVTANRYNKVK